MDGSIIIRKLKISEGITEYQKTAALNAGVFFDHIFFVDIDKYRKRCYG